MKFLACGIMLLSAMASCTKSRPQTELAQTGNAKPEPYVTMDGNGQDWTGWTEWIAQDRVCRGEGRTCAPEVVIEYKMTFWDHLIREWNRKCTDDPYWNFNGKVKDDPSFRDLITDASFKSDFCEVHSISTAAYDEMTLGQFFKLVFPAATDQIMARIGSGNYAVRLVDNRSRNRMAYLMGCPKGADPAISPEFVLQWKF